MIKFERKFLYCFADIAAAKELIGKEGLFFDDYLSDKDLLTLELKSLVDVFLPYDLEARGLVFKNNLDRYKFFYYDPNLGCKRAFYLKGKEIQWRSDGFDWTDCKGEPCWASDNEYRIKPETETRLTNREVAEWLAKGNGEILSLDNMRNHILNYSELAEKLLCECKIRKWSDSEWHEATKEYVSEVAE